MILPQIKFEWLDAPGVRDEALAKTWCRFELWVGDKCLTQAIDKKSNALRTGVYGSLLPLTEWLVENWWTILHETHKSGVVSKDWRKRHTFLAARDGGALPNLHIYRSSNELIELAWYDDESQQNYPVKFISKGLAQIKAEEVQIWLTTIINATLDRLKENGLQAQIVQENWQAVLESMATEQSLCVRLAQLGLDPYDSQEVTPSILKSVQTISDEFPKSQVDDIFDVSTPMNWQETCRNTLRANSLIHRAKGPAAKYHPIQLMNGTTPPFDVGRDAAHKVRRDVARLGDRTPVTHFRSLLKDRFHWTRSNQAGEAPIGSSINGIVGFSKSETPVFIGPARQDATHDFRLARALYFAVTDKCRMVPKLITDAQTFDQSASRAFAAEFFAPSRAIVERISRGLSAELIDSIAKEFGVESMVVYNQIRNNKLVSAEELASIM